MDALISLALLFFFLFLGMLLARIPGLAGGAAVKKLSGLVLFALLFFMGFRMARTTEGAEELARIGLLSVGFALSGTAGTLAVLLFLFRLFREDLRSAGKSSGTDFPVSADPEPVREGSRKENPDSALLFKKKPAVSAGHLKDPLRLMAFVAAGFLAGLFLPAGGITGENLSTWMLRILLLFIGMDLAAGGISFREVLAHRKTLLLPLGTAAGSLLGGLLMAPLFGLAPSQTLAVSSGFGWYSLSGVLITDMGNPFLGSAAFMSNILRETIALVTIPLLGGTRYSLLAVGVGGATSMDVTLPLIERSCGTEAVPLAIASGALLSLLVPVLVPLFYNLG